MKRGAAPCEETRCGLRPLPRGVGGRGRDSLWLLNAVGQRGQGSMESKTPASPCAFPGSQWPPGPWRGCQSEPRASGGDPEVAEGRAVGGQASPRALHRVDDHNDGTLGLPGAGAGDGRAEQGPCPRGCVPCPRPPQGLWNPDPGTRRNLSGGPCLGGCLLLGRPQGLSEEAWGQEGGPPDGPPPRPVVLQLRSPAVAVRAADPSPPAWRPFLCGAGALAVPLRTPVLTAPHPLQVQPRGRVGSR